MTINILRVSNVKVEFGKLRAVDDVDLILKKGDAVGLIGPNGAGKSTLFNLINGVIPCSSGAIYFEEKKINNSSLHHIARLGIGRTFQTARPFRELTIEENLLLAGLDKTLTYRTKELDDCRIFAREIAELVGISNYLTKKTDDLPYGVLKRLDVARALMTKPRLLLMDEPFAGIGGEEADRMLSCVNFIKQSGITILIVEHKLHMLMRLVGTIIVMNAGRIIAHGNPADIASNSDVQTAYLGRKGGQYLVGN